MARRVLVTHNGRYGDLLWALPTVRAIARRLGEPVHLLIPGEFASIAPLLRQQSYLAQVLVHPGWAQGDRTPWGNLRQITDVQYPGGELHQIDAVIDLGYRGWPEPDCVRHTMATANLALFSKDVAGPITWDELQLVTPWITIPPSNLVLGGFPLVLAFSDVHFEMKYGLSWILRMRGISHKVIGENPRWQTEGLVPATTWEESVHYLQQARVVLACCSALHVLAVAVGTPVLLMEPLEARWNPVFYPLGMDGPQVTVIRGNDGRPTHDARHIVDVLSSRLQEIARP